MLRAPCKVRRTDRAAAAGGGPESGTLDETSAQRSCACLKFEFPPCGRLLSMSDLELDSYPGGRPVGIWVEAAALCHGEDEGLPRLLPCLWRAVQGRGDVVPGCSSLSSCAGKQGVGALRVLLPELYGDNPVCMRTAAEHGLSRSMRSANDGTSWESCSGHSLRFCRQRKPSPWCRDGRQDAVGGREDTEGVFQMALGADWNGSYDNAYGLNMGRSSCQELPLIAGFFSSGLSCRTRRRVPFAGQKKSPAGTEVHAGESSLRYPE